jgi:hypothetical protein
MPTSSWTIYYADGTTFSNENGTVRDAPRIGVVAIVQTNEDVGWEIVHAFTYYYFEESVGGWRCSDQFGMYDHLIRCRDPLILFGRFTDDKTYNSLLKKIREKYGDKSGWLQREIRRDS